MKPIAIARPSPSTSPMPSDERTVESLRLRLVAVLLSVLAAVLVPANIAAADPVGDTRTTGQDEAYGACTTGEVLVHDILPTRAGPCDTTNSATTVPGAFTLRALVSGTNSVTVISNMTGWRRGNLRYEVQVLRNGAVIDSIMRNCSNCTSLDSHNRAYSCPPNSITHYEVRGIAFGSGASGGVSMSDMAFCPC